MLVQIGQRSAPQDVVDTLYECHARIRKFLSFATQLATARVPDDEAREVASQIHRYFAVSFPLHLADEDELITPLLSTQRTLAATLARMQRDHADHEEAVARLASLSARIEREPRALGDLHSALGETAQSLSAALEPHLALEEREIFPALRGLPAPVRDELRGQMRARRERVM